MYAYAAIRKESEQVFQQPEGLQSFGLPFRTPPFFIQHILFIFLSLQIITSCASVSPVSSARERPAAFASIEDIIPAWQVFTDGIEYFHGRAVSPNIEFHALKVDLTLPYLHIVVGGSAHNTPEDGSMLSTRVSSFVRDNNLVAGINVTPFNIVSAKEGQLIKNVGIIISNGSRLSPANPQFDALVFYTDGTAAIVNQAAINSMENIDNAIGGFRQILKDGELAERILNLEPRHPRSAAGISPNGKFLYLLVIDGRRSGSIGATEKETALVLRALGSQDGINFDGGGSTALALRYPNGKVRTVNTPIHSGFPGRERAVAGCLGISLSRER
jgi:hypothetical protein